VFPAVVKRMAWSFVFVLCTLLAVTFTARSAINCPQMCTCQQSNNRSLVIDCGGRKINASFLYNALELLLSDDELRERLTLLQISNTPLTEVPVSVCRLSKLIWLNLNRNRLVRLPNDCINNMTELYRNWQRTIMTSPIFRMDSSTASTL